MEKDSLLKVEISLKYAVKQAKFIQKNKNIDPEIVQCNKCMLDNLIDMYSNYYNLYLKSVDKKDRYEKEPLDKLYLLSDALKVRSKYVNDNYELDDNLTK